MKIDISKITIPTKLFLKKHTPEILVFLGVGGAVSGGVMACRATYHHLDEILTDHVVRAESARENPENKKELARVYFRTGLDLARLYGPSLTVEALSVAGILAGNNILRKRNVALAAAYAAVDQGFRDYRGRVVERFGEEADRELRYGLHKEKKEETIVDENGKKKKVKRDITVADGGAPSDYARFFAKGEAKAAEGIDSYDLFYLRSQQELANHMLRAKGFLFLNDIYELLGIDPSIPGQMVGWVYDQTDEAIGDNYVDFRIQEVYRKRSDEPGDYEKVFLIDPNVDGCILEHASAKGLVTN